MAEILVVGGRGIGGDIGHVSGVAVGIVEI